MRSPKLLGPMEDLVPDPILCWKVVTPRCAICHDVLHSWNVSCRQQNPAVKTPLPEVFGDPREKFHSAAHAIDIVHGGCVVGENQGGEVNLALEEGLDGELRCKELPDVDGVLAFEIRLRSHGLEMIGACSPSQVGCVCGDDPRWHWEEECSLGPLG